jgi:hypothetical protein
MIAAGLEPEAIRGAAAAVARPALGVVAASGRYQGVAYAADKLGVPDTIEALVGKARWRWNRKSRFRNSTRCWSVGEYDGSPVRFGPGAVHKLLILR